MNKSWTSCNKSFTFNEQVMNKLWTSCNLVINKSWTSWWTSQLFNGLKKAAIAVTTMIFFYSVPIRLTTSFLGQNLNRKRSGHWILSWHLHHPITWKRIFQREYYLVGLLIQNKNSIVWIQEYYNPAIAAVNRMQGYPARQTLENISENNL